MRSDETLIAGVRGLAFGAQQILNLGANAAEPTYIRDVRCGGNHIVDRSSTAGDHDEHH